MFQNEFDYDETCTTILDDEGKYEDVRVIIDEDEVFIRQWDEDQQVYDVIVMSHKMFLELQHALKHPEGFFRTEI